MFRDALTRLFPALARLDRSCYVVGGAVRDLIAGQSPGDIDLACDDPLAAARAISPRVITLGNEEHLRAYRVVLGEHVYDFAELLDHDIGRDLSRRDFTMNAMAIDLRTDALLDPHGGRHDLEQRIVRMVHPSNFDDDPLRMLKGVRMAVRYGFELGPATLEAVKPRAEKVRTVARERIDYELSVIFSSNRLRQALALLRETGLAEALGLQAPEVHADEISLDGAYALVLPEPRGDAAALRRLIDRHDRIALYDAGETIARQLPAVLRALGRDEEVDWPDFSIRAWLTGDEIARISGLPPGRELGRIKRALLEAQIRGEVRTREDAERFVTTAST
jgi:tRNA nucleotidyltransferase (CCA-adding enzyme)